MAKKDNTAPFTFGKLISGGDFVNRRMEIERLKINFKSGINTILISPRRWGKSSLIRQVAHELKDDKKVKFCMIDLYKVREPEDFYNLLIQELFTKTNSKADDIIASTRKFFKSIIPKISYNPLPDSEISFGFEWSDIKKNQDELLNMAEEIAKSKGIQIVLCIDEFQNIATFEEPIGFQKKLRANWQHHEHVTYCLYGSKRHMMMEVFSSRAMPFYKFGDLMFLEKISEEEWVPFIMRNFRKSGKSISKDSATHLVQQADRHSYYVQQLAYMTWLMTDTECGIEIIDKALLTILRQLSLLFQTITDDLSKTQINYLKARIAKEEKMSSQAVLRKYKLGTSGNIAKIKKALKEKEILDFVGKKEEFGDPMYKHWLDKFYFNGAINL